MQDIMKQKQPARPKHVPKRTCVACRQVEGKRSLIRLVRTEAGVEVDTSGKKQGRGMYLHSSQKCWEIALKSGRIEQALRTKLSQDNRDNLLRFATTLPAAEEESERPGSPLGAAVQEL